VFIPKIADFSENFSSLEGIMDIPHGGIGFFDSGLGGLTVLFACRSVCGDLPVYYYGDNARAPYGGLSSEIIKNYAAEAFDTFSALGARAAVIACNTVTAVCADSFRKIYPFPIVGAEPAVFPAAERCGEIFVLATPATVASLRFQRLCLRAVEKYPDAHIRVFGCEGLAGAVEKHFFSEDFDFTPFLPRGSPDGVVLGCTHYVFLKKFIKEFYDCPVFDGNEGIKHRLSTVLSENFSRCEHSRPPETTFRGFFPPVTTFVPEKEKNICFGLPGSKYPFFYEPEKLSNGLFPGSSKITDPLKENNTANRCSPNFPENRENWGKKGAFSGIFFLGSGKMVNKSVCEQMFTYKIGVDF
jgi:glutamate racemase